MDPGDFGCLDINFLANSEGKLDIFSQHDSLRGGIARLSLKKCSMIFLKF
jgi:hypothetical protein